MAAACGVGLVTWAVGVSLLQSLMLATLAAAVVPLTYLQIDPTRAFPPVLASRRFGFRHDVSRLSMAMSRRKHHSNEAIVRRVQVLAIGRLRDLQIDVENPVHGAAAERLLGSWEYAVLIAGNSAPIRRRDITRCVAAVERLGDARRLGGPRRQEAMPPPHGGLEG